MEFAVASSLPFLLSVQRARRRGSVARIVVASAASVRQGDFMPFAFYEPYRRRVSKARYRVPNGPACDRGPIGRGDLRFRITNSALAAETVPRRPTRDGRARRSDVAIETMRIPASVFRLPPRQAEGTPYARARP